ncbi:PIG-L deacetylase family protein [Stygiolobus caldivivus]|uniref:PIG-L family deacetylase n=1 Tax=Stygiolobus caldivivus TaxID=2824673 RepID=A0A8D5U5Q8_9CREN|nr:PIG-L deacetylase family protein [Stygiolobus caldivivus]BCU69986.1 hypothetical protein KN1_12830 [Stygiolobus caldivivus]
MRVMFIGAHPDDIELGAGGTLLKHVRKGDQVLYVILSKGEKGGEPKEREKEVLEIISYLGIKDYKLFSFHDTLLNTKFNEIKDELETIIKDFDPDRLYTHSLNDSHQDHRTVAEAVKIAGRRVPQVLSFWAPLLYNNFSPNYFIDISDVFEEKLKVLEKYKSQGHRDYLKREVIAGINKYFGYINNVDYAEGFEIIKYREVF